MAKTKQEKYEYIQNHQKKTYDDIRLRVKKGKRETYKLQAAAHGMSLQAYIISLLEADADCTGVADQTETDPAHSDQ